MNLKNRPKAKKKKRSWYNPYSDLVKILSGWFVYFMYRPKIHRYTQNVPKRIKGGVLIASNHISCHDAVILFVAFWNRRLSFLATKDIFEKTINRIFFTGMNCIPIDKENPGMSSIKRVCNRLSHKGAVVIFPEGEINKGEGLLSFKEGTAYMAYRSNCPVLPVYTVPGKRRFRDVSHVIVGEPVDVSAICRRYPRAEGIKRASEYLMEREAELEAFYNEYIKKDGQIYEKCGCEKVACDTVGDTREYSNV